MTVTMDEYEASVVTVVDGDASVVPVPAVVVVVVAAVVLVVVVAAVVVGAVVVAGAAVVVGAAGIPVQAGTMSIRRTETSADIMAMRRL